MKMTKYEEWLLKTEYKDIKKAINAGNFVSAGEAIACIGWNQKKAAWIIYPTMAGCPKELRPEFLCIGSGILPLPLSDEGRQIFEELFCQGI